MQQEIADTDLLQTLNETPEINIISVEQESVEGDTQLLGAGELECIMLCGEDDLLLMDDRNAGEIAEKNNIDVTNIPGFLLALKETEHVEGSRIREIVEALQSEDHYQLTKEDREELGVDT